MFGRPPANFGPPGPFPGPGLFSQLPMQPPPQQGGFLARLLGGGTSGPGVAGGFGGGPGPGNILGFLNPSQGGGLLGTLQNVEKVINFAQQVKPMIDQFGPMVKNIPSMLNLIKEYQEYSNTQGQSNENTNNNEATDKGTSETQNVLADLSTETSEESSKPKAANKKKVDVSKPKVIKAKKQTESKKSLPKLYI